MQLAHRPPTIDWAAPPSPSPHSRRGPVSRRSKAICRVAEKDKDQDQEAAPPKTPGAILSSGDHFKQKNLPEKRRVRPAYLRSNDDSPLRDANRDIMLGVLTARSVRTLVVYLQETNLNVAQWLVRYMHENPITLKGTWEDISGDTFLKKLLSSPIQDAKFNQGVDALHDNFSSIGVDPRQIAQRIMDIRAQLAKEIAEDLSLVQEDNNEILRQSLHASLRKCLEMADCEDACQGFDSEGSASSSSDDDRK